MNKSSLVALSLGLLAVLSCFDLVVHGQSCFPPHCRRRLQDSFMSARVKRRTQAMAVESSLHGNLHDSRAEVEHPDVEFIEKS